ncbi:hypothetical protein IV38_GL000404 [Lactobacillus selangorensis]|uniref:DUF488 domain-containing protein n=1 Tax=Lactobacillus selangorensis TaxID=81857 RepID=A0A0R2FLM0_9LACO|nr:DUF488 domain-containing protein [Lactobacillus selangorensis]KRN29519.1 hypothetical protein IV38_GL000404 [Lactobacillus selangorensis]KRN33951.1 hypothetical protein IV40_GL000264 [Lactobacillus selangorensis]
MGQLQIKRAYTAAAPSDGTRLLVDRIWPRGVSKEKAALTDWDKNIAPSTELRQWFVHDPVKFPEFTKRYLAELNQNPAAAQFKQQVQTALKTGNVTLIYGAKDTTHNQAVVLQQWLQK